MMTLEESATGHCSHKSSVTLHRIPTSDSTTFNRESVIEWLCLTETPNSRLLHGLPTSPSSLTSVATSKAFNFLKTLSVSNWSLSMHRLVGKNLAILQHKIMFAAHVIEISISTSEQDNFMIKHVNSTE